MPADTIERSITAFLDGEDSLQIDNIIHSTQGAAQFGYTAPLVGGVTVYAWAVPAIIEGLGQAWLDRGWIDLSLRRPVYPGDHITTRVVPRDPDHGGGIEFTMTKADGTKTDGQVCIAGVAGLDDAPFLNDLATPLNRQPQPRSEPQTLLTPDILPVGEDIPAMTVPISTSDAADYAADYARDHHPRWQGDHARVHPAWIAARCTRLLRHTYRYPAAIHAGSQIQHLAPIHAGQTLTVSGHLTDGYQRKGHHYCLLDVAITDPQGVDLARLRHRTIYQVAQR